MSSEALIPGIEYFHQQALLPIRSVAVEAIFNRHGTVEDAALSAEHIEPDSLVFLEGMDLSEVPLENSILNAITNLGIFRLEHGKLSDRYVRQKQVILDVIDNVLIEEQDSPVGIDGLWPIAMCQKLLEKDCIVFVSDLKKSEIPVEQHATIDDLVPTNYGFMTKFDPSRSLGRTIRSAYDEHDKVVAMQDLREQLCVIDITDKLIALFGSYPVDVWQLNRSPDNKLQVYTVWGTAHAHSLSHKLKEKGYEVANTIVDTNEHINFIEPDSENGSEQVPMIALADILLTGILLSPYCKDENGPVLGSLISDLRYKTDVSPTDMYIRAYQLCKSAYSLREALELASEEHEQHAIFDRLHEDTVNLRNLLQDIGLDPDKYLEKV